jgi:hypothetical protein
VPAAPAVRLADRNGEPVAGIPVTFEVTAGGGAVYAASVTTDDDGIASSEAWTLGFEPGPNLLTATVEDVPAVTFEAVGTDPCLTIVSVKRREQLVGTVSEVDCVQAGMAGDSISMRITSQMYVRFDLESTSDVVFDMAGVALGPFPHGFVEVMLAPGEYHGVVKGGPGPYTLWNDTVRSDLDGCRTRIVTPGITTRQHVSPQVDCRGSGGDYDRYAIELQAGRRYTFVVTEPKRIEVWSADGAALLADNVGAEQTAFYFTPEETGDYQFRVIRLTSLTETLEYRLTII